MEKYFGFAKELLDKGLAIEHASYDESNTYDQTITVTSDIPFYLELAEKSNGKILDIGCGTGRITKPLMDAGYSVLGMDLSKPMLEIADKKLRAAGHEPMLIQGNMKDFDLGEQFSLIIIPYCSLVYISTDEERQQIFRSVHRHLKPGGMFAFDFDAGICTVGEGRPWISMQYLNPETDEIIVQIVQCKGFHEHLRVINMINYRTIANQTTIEVQADIEATCLAKRMKELLEATGFTVQGIYSDYQYTPYTEGELCMMLAVK